MPDAQSIRSFCKDLVARGEEDPRLKQNWLWRQADLTLKTEEWFEAAVAETRANVPPLEGCVCVAVAILTVQDFLRHRRETSSEAPRVRAEWRRLQRALARAERCFAPEPESASQRVRIGPGFHATIAEIERQMTWVLVLVGAIEPIDEIRFIAVAARKAWGLTERIPRSLQPNGPLCKFVERALDYLGMARGRETISAVLRGRRRR